MSQSETPWEWIRMLPASVLAAMGTAYIGVRVWLARHDEQLVAIRHSQQEMRDDIRQVDNKVERLVDHLLRSKEE